MCVRVHGLRDRGVTRVLVLGLDRERPEASHRGPEPVPDDEEHRHARVVSTADPRRSASRGGAVTIDARVHRRPVLAVLVVLAALAAAAPRPPRPRRSCGPIANLYSGTC